MKKTWLFGAVSVLTVGAAYAQICLDPNPLVGQSPGVGAIDIPTTDFDINAALKQSWDCAKSLTTGLTTCGLPAPPAAATDDVGAFRFICAHRNLANDDPTVFPYQPGKSHLHDQTGVDLFNAMINYVMLRQHGGGSGCNDIAGADHNLAETSWSANRTPYWQPGLLDGKGNVILADYISVYYKRIPKDSPYACFPSTLSVLPAGTPKCRGIPVKLPQGIKYVFGNHNENPALPPDPHANVRFNCVRPNGSVEFNSNTDMVSALRCAQQPGYWFEVAAGGPDCWDTKNLDSPDHRSHIVYGSYGNWGYLRCPVDHPDLIPVYTYAAFYTILPTDDINLIHFSSDESAPTKPHGWSFHVDYGPAAWDPIVLNMWTDNCIDKKLNCSGGDLGNGKQLKGAGTPIYYTQATNTWLAAMHNPHRLQPIPPISTM